jgi:hypothetical protein
LKGNAIGERDFAFPELALNGGYGAVENQASVLDGALKGV